MYIIKPFCLILGPPGPFPHTHTTFGDKFSHPLLWTWYVMFTVQVT